MALIPAPAGLFISSNDPTDQRWQVKDLKARDNMIGTIAWEGMITYVVDEKKWYRLGENMQWEEWTLGTSVDLSGIQTQIDDLELKTDNLLARTDSLEVVTDNLSSNQAILVNNVNDLESGQTSLTSRVSGLETKTNSLQSGQNSLTTRVNSVEGDVNKLYPIKTVDLGERTVGTFYDIIVTKAELGVSTIRDVLHVYQSSGNYLDFQSNLRVMAINKFTDRITIYLSSIDGTNVRGQSAYLTVVIAYS